MGTITEEIRSNYELIQLVKKNLDELGVDVQKRQPVIRKYRDRIALLQNKLVDPLSKPVTVEWRHGYVHEGEGGYDYVILADEDESDDELSEWFDDYVAYPPIYSPYDCTGKRFTWGKHINRTPAGIVVIHRWSLDI